MINLLLEPLKYDFMRIALITSLIVGVTCSVLSSFIVLRGWSLLGDAVSHAVLPGLTLSYMLALPFFWGALLTGIASSVLIGVVEAKSKVRNDTAIGIVFTGAFALGFVALSRIRPSIDVFHVLFGNVLGVSPDDLAVTAYAGAVVFAAIALWLKEIVAFTFDPTFCKVIGLPVNLIHYSLMVLLSLAIVASLQTVGIVLVVSLLVTPGATAQLFARRISEMIAISLTVGATSAVTGLYLSYYLAVSSGGSIALIATLLFFLSMLYLGLKRKLTEAARHTSK